MFNNNITEYFLLTQTNKIRYIIGRPNGLEDAKNSKKKKETMRITF